MVVGVALDLEEHPIGDAVAGVPGVHPARALVVVVEAPVVRLLAAALAPEAVVLDVVRVVREEGGEQRLHELHRQRTGPEVAVDGQVDGEGHQEGREDAVLRAEEAPAAATLELLLQAQRRDEALVPTLEDEGPEGLVQRGAGGVLVGGHALMVAPEVLHPEVVVVGEQQHGAAVVHLQERWPVDELVDAADAEARGDAQGAGDAPEGRGAQAILPAQVAGLGAHVPGQADEASRIGPDVRAGVHAEPDIAPQRHLFLGRGVVGVLAHHEVQDRDRDEADHEGREGVPVVASGGSQVDAEEYRGQGREVHDVGQRVEEVRASATFPVEARAPLADACVVLGGIEGFALLPQDQAREGHCGHSHCCEEHHSCEHLMASRGGCLEGGWPPWQGHARDRTEWT
mmetsp:Transcript_10376/g.23622  ORF Transcript_10376/g.23622 Transcript_10376/m.23622 type:complete len:400 (-) Transcript_10376:18-1217(-)